MPSTTESKSSPLWAICALWSAQASTDSTFSNARSFGCASSRNARTSTSRTRWASPSRQHGPARAALSAHCVPTRTLLTFRRPPMVDRSPSGDLPILGELRRDLLAAFRAAEAPHRGRFTRRTRRQLLRRSVAFAFVASGVAALGLASGIFDEHLGPSNARAAQVLYAAAVVADRHPVPFPQDDEFYYVRSITTRLEPVSGVSRPLLRRAVRESPKVYVTIAGATWTSATRTGLTEQRLVAVRFSTPAARTRWRRLHRPSLLGLASGPTAIAATNGHYLLGNLELSRERLLHFPTNTHALYRRLYLAGGSPAEVFTEIGDALRERPVPARLRAALYRTLALVPGV